MPVPKRKMPRSRTRVGTSRACTRRTSWGLTPVGLNVPISSHSVVELSISVIRKVTVPEGRGVRG
jgi:hypothetical protein